jgi:hypothetical protein
MRQDGQALSQYGSDRFLGGVVQPRLASGRVVNSLSAREGRRVTGRNSASGFV